MFLDEASISVRAGDGGSGCVAFRREKFVPRGGPSGGDGGRGGHIHMQASMRHNTLIQYRYKRVFRARRGTHGRGSKCHGRDAADLTLTVPVGTVARDASSGDLVHDFLVADEKILLCRGGRGGRGNAQFTSSVNQAPRRFEYGFLGESRELKLELKLLADVGLVGFPNVGKSTLISRLSAARPKIASYPFTTLQPNLGVVELEDYRSFVVADIPGLIAGAHLGQGLGIQFLRHIERTKVLLHMVDLAGDHGRDPVVDYETVNRELAAFNPAMLQKPTLVVASKIDAIGDSTQLGILSRLARSRGLECHSISAVTGQGLQDLKLKIWGMLETLAGERVTAAGGNGSHE